MADQLVALACSPDMVEAATAEVVRALAFPARFPHLSSLDSMRQRVADNIVSLAFRRYVSAEQIPHKVVESVNFTQLDWLDISFGGRRCIPFAQLICRRNLIRQVHKNPESILDHDVFLLEGSAAPAYRDVDIYLFIHLTALVTRSRDDVEKAIVAGQPVYLVHEMPEEWAAPAKWHSLDPLVLKTDQSSPLPLDLHGQDQQRGYQFESLALPGRERVELTPDLYSLGLVRAGALPSGPVGIHSQFLDDTLIVAPFQWGNIWVYGLRMYMTGYITQADFYRHAKRVHADGAVLANPCLEGESLLSIPASALKPPRDLFVRAANWAQMKNK